MAKRRSVRRPSAAIPAGTGGELHQRAQSAAQTLTTNQGTRVSDNQNSLRAGSRGPTLLEDFVLREKITHFDHERIPERIVHARGSGAHGYFQVYRPLGRLTKAAFLQDPKKKTEVFVRFSTVAGGAGSGDLPRDVRGFAVKFYTDGGRLAARCLWTPQGDRVHRRGIADLRGRRDRSRYRPRWGVSSRSTAPRASARSSPPQRALVSGIANRHCESRCKT